MRASASADKPSPTSPKSPQPLVDAIRTFLQGGVVFSSLDQAVTLQRSLPHGHVALLLGLATQLGLPRILHRTPGRQRDLALVALIACLIHPSFKLATARGLSQVERAFRSLKTTRLDIRPVFVYSEEHVRGHVFLCLLAWYLKWHLRRRLAPLLFEDEAPALRDSPVQKAEPSPQAKAKAATRKTPDGDPVHSLTTLLQNLGTVTLNQVTLPGQPNSAFTLVTQATSLQDKVFRMLKIDPDKGVAINKTG